MTADNNSRFYVYVHRRKTDNTIFYVGKGSGARIYKTIDRSIFWQNIVNKNGVIKEFVLQNLTERQAMSLEIQLIAHYGRNNLCNLTDGGEGSAGYVMPEHRKKFISALHLGRKRPVETGNKISKALKGRKLSNESKIKISEKLKGQVLSLDTRLKMSVTRAGKKHTEEWKANIAKAWDCSPERYAQRCKAMADSKASKKVLCLDTGKIFTQIKLAVEWIKSLNVSKNPNHSKIVMCCQSKRNTAYGYRWQYVNE